MLQALIGKDGTIQNLHVVSGHPMLTGAALDAVKQWKYKPYYLNGEPVEVETTINVNFTLVGWLEIAHEHRCLHLSFSAGACWSGARL